MPGRAPALRALAVPVACLLLGGASGWLLRDARGRGPRHPPPVPRREGGYRFIRPLLDCPGVEQAEGELTPFRSKVQAYLRSDLRFPGVETVSVYFRELNDGTLFAAGDSDLFAAASLRKLPMMIALLKEAERDPAFLGRKVPFLLREDHSAQQNIKPSTVMTPGESYTVEELIRRMIVYSDNNAFTLASTVVDPVELAATYARLDLDRPPEDPAVRVSLVRTYASFLRILYNASYLSREHSEWALALLTQTEFTAGIREGVPEGIAVAHKFGEASESRGGFQLHDCGIVYYPGHPYVLCVATRGTAFEYLDDAIASISRFIAAEVRAQALANR